MASLKKAGPITGPYKDCAVPYKGPGTADGHSFGGAVIPDGPPASKGEMAEVQFADIKGGEPGKKSPMKVRGGGSY